MSGAPLGEHALELLHELAKLPCGDGSRLFYVMPSYSQLPPKLNDEGD